MSAGKESLFDARPPRSMSGHQLPHRGKSDTWLTPPEIIDALGPFDIDPCAAPDPRPWRTAVREISLPEDGLTAAWDGFAWVNPPYGPDTWTWLERLADHGNGIALIFARTETAGFFKTVWRRADALRFIEGRLHFHRPDGTRAAFNAGAPSVLVAYGYKAMVRLSMAAIPGEYVELNDLRDVGQRAA